VLGLSCVINVKAFFIPMTASILGLHHGTAAVDDAQSDLDLVINALGLRLVKTSTLRTRVPNAKRSGA